MQRVQFIKKHPPYNVGETAGFSEAAAARLLKAGKVEFIEAAKKKRTPKEATPSEGQNGGAGEQT